MADWPTIRTALEAWVEAITGLEAVWMRPPQDYIFGDQGYIILDIIGRRGVGNDTVEYEYDSTAAAGAEIRTYQRGARQFTLTVQVNTFSADDGEDAITYTSLIRDSLDLPQVSSAVFAAADIAFARIMADVSPGQYQIDGRETEVAEIQIRFNATAEVEDTATGYIETLADFEFYDTDDPTPPLWTGDIEVT